MPHTAVHKHPSHPRAVGLSVLGDGEMGMELPNLLLPDPALLLHRCDALMGSGHVGWLIPGV